MKKTFQDNKSTIVDYAATALLICTLLAGCGQEPSSAKTDANGYLCANGHKFYTDSNVFAEQCPECETQQLWVVYAYGCEKEPQAPNMRPGCGHVTLAPQASRQGLLCANCGLPLASRILPHAEDLNRWGAQKRTQEETQLR